MNLEEQLMAYKKLTQSRAQEEKIQETIGKSREAFYRSEREGALVYHEFLWTQLKVIQKRWWILQLLILLALWAALALEHDEMYIQRSMGVMSSLFVILIIPELWKNRTYRSLEIEAVSYYSLRQIYAARMLLFGIADIFLLTIFCQAASMGLHIGLMELMVQFLFPLSVTACICFAALCSRRCFRETVAIALCVIWSAVWLFIILNENVYAMVAFPIWFFLFGLALVCLGAIVYHTLKSCDEYREALFDGIDI